MKLFNLVNLIVHHRWILVLFDPIKRSKVREQGEP